MSQINNWNQIVRHFGVASVHKGTSLTVGYRKRQNDRSVRRFYVNTTTNTITTLGDAVILAAAFAGNWHPSIIDLPLQKVRAFRHGPKKVICDVVYQRDRFSTPPYNAFNSAAWVNSFESVNVYRSKVKAVGGLPVTVIDPETGLPEGDFHAGPKNVKSTPPQGKPWQAAILKLYVNTVLTENPLITDRDLFRLKNTTNGDEDIQFGGVTFPPNTVRFDDFEIRFTQRRSQSDLWAVTYAFSARRGGWVSQDLVWNQADENGLGEYALPLYEPNEWITPKIDVGGGVLVYPDMYTREIFHGHFPVHTG